MNKQIGSARVWHSAFPSGLPSGALGDIQ